MICCCLHLSSSISLSATELNGILKPEGLPSKFQIGISPTLTASCATGELS